MKLKIYAKPIVKLNQNIIGNYTNKEKKTGKWKYSLTTYTMNKSFMNEISYLDLRLS